MRWCQFCLNLLGDPEMPIWTATPEVLDVTYPDSLPIGPSNFTVTVMDGGSPLESARVCVYKADESFCEYDFTGSDGSVNFTLSPAMLGEMLVTVTYSGYMPHQGTSEVTGTVAPEAEFTGNPQLGYAPLAVQFTDLTYGTVDSYSWDFGDGDTSSAQHPLHSFETPGIFDVTLIVSGVAGSDTMEKLAYVETMDPDSGWLSSNETGYPRATELSLGMGGEATINMIMDLTSDTAHALMFPLCYDVDYLALQELAFDTAAFPNGRDGAWNFFERDTVMNDSGKFMLYAWTGSYTSGLPIGVHRIGFATFAGIDTGACIIDTCWYPPQGHLSYSNGPTSDDYWPSWQSVNVSVVSELCGDANGDGGITTGDGYYILNYFGSGPDPVSCWAANVNGDGGLTTGDGYHVLNWFGSGPALNCMPCE
jgi:PKD repeat protein